MKKTTKLVIEKESLIVLTRSRAVNKWCGICGLVVQMIDTERAALISGVSQRVIFRAIEDGRLHFAETENGTLLICYASLIRI